MSPPTLLDPDHLDALREVVNIAMGQAGASLACVLDTFVQLSVPRLRLVQAADIGSAVAAVLQTTGRVTAVRQAFYDGLQGEAFTIFGDDGCASLASLMGYSTLAGPSAGRGILIDVANIVSGACLCGIGAQLSLSLAFSRPSLHVQHVRPEEIFSGDALTWGTGLLMEVHFRIEGHASFVCHLVTMLREEAVTAVHRAVDHFLEAL